MTRRPIDHSLALITAAAFALALAATPGCGAEVSATSEEAIEEPLPTEEDVNDEPPVDEDPIPVDEEEPAPSEPDAGAPQPPEPDAGTPPPPPVDAGTPPPPPDDAGTPPPLPPVDAGTPPPPPPDDAGTPPPPPPVDAGSPPSPVVDAGTPPDAGTGSGRVGPPVERPLPPSHPGGWPRSTFVFSEGAMRANNVNDDWVEVGWFELDSTVQVTTCGVAGPRVKRTWFHWAHDATYPAGDCTKDRDVNGSHKRWDHSTVLVDGCPGADRAGLSGFVDAQGRPKALLANCPAHITAGFGEASSKKTRLGRYAYDATRRTLVFTYQEGNRCVSESFRGLSGDAGGGLLSMALDGAATGRAGGTGATHGFAYGSSAPITRFVTLTQGAQDLRTRNFKEASWQFREGKGAVTPPRPDKTLGYRPGMCRNRQDVAYQHSCNSGEGTPESYLKECHPRRRAYLKFIVDPFPNRSSRENLFWGWHADKDARWTGCYHGGSHSKPLLQIIDAAGNFRGYVGVEIQRSSKGHSDTDFEVFRWIEDGFLEQ